MPEGTPKEHFSIVEKDGSKAERVLVDVTESDNEFSGPERERATHDFATRLIKLLKSSDAHSAAVVGAKLQNRITRGVISGEIDSEEIFIRQVKEIASQDPERNLSKEAEVFFVGIQSACNAARAEQQISLTRPEKTTIVGTNNYLDARQMIDLVSVVIDNETNEVEEVRLVQVKSARVEATEAHEIAKAHGGYAEHQMASVGDMVQRAQEHEITQDLVGNVDYWGDIIEIDSEVEFETKLQDFFDPLLTELLDSQGPVTQEMVEGWSESIGLPLEVIKLFFEHKKGKQMAELFAVPYGIPESKVQNRMQALLDWGRGYEMDQEVMTQLTWDDFDAHAVEVGKVTSVIYDSMGNHLLQEENVTPGSPVGLKRVDKTRYSA